MRIFTLFIFNPLGIFYTLTVFFTGAFLFAAIFPDSLQYSSYIGWAGMISLAVLGAIFLFTEYNKDFSNYVNRNEVQSLFDKQTRYFRDRFMERFDVWDYEQTFEARYFYEDLFSVFLDKETYKQDILRIEKRLRQFEEPETEDTSAEDEEAEASFKHPQDILTEIEENAERLRKQFAEKGVAGMKAEIGKQFADLTKKEAAADE